MSNDDLLDILDLVTSRLDGGAEFVLRLVSNTTEEIRDNGAPDFWVVFAAAGLPENEAFVRMVNENAVPGLKQGVSPLL